MKTERQKVSLTIYTVAFMGGHSEVRCGFGHQPQPHMTSCTSVRFYTKIVEIWGNNSFKIKIRQTPKKFVKAFLHYR